MLLSNHGWEGGAQNAANACDRYTPIVAAVILAAENSVGHSSQASLIRPAIELGRGYAAKPIARRDDPDTYRRPAWWRAGARVPPPSRRRSRLQAVGAIRSLRQCRNKAAELPAVLLS